MTTPRFCSWLDCFRDLQALHDDMEMVHYMVNFKDL